MPGLQTGQPLSATPQPVSDATGVASALSLSTTSVGIGTPSPEVALHVAGSLKLELNGSPTLSLFSHGFGSEFYSIRATNDADNAGGRRLVFRNEGRGQDIIVIDNDGNVSFAGDIRLTGADCAEQFKVAGDECDPGSVMVIDAQETLRCCTEPYDPRVAGVISGASARRPGLTLGGGIRDDSARPVALSGTVFCKADATVESVSVGDLLTTSANPGHAMKASDRTRAFGCVLGKAMGELTAGVGLIPILVTLN
jgi:hypothetical protein